MQISVQAAMKTPLLRITLALLVACLGASCTTAYDAYGYPRQVVEPGAAIAGAAAVGLLAYGLADHHGHHGHHGHAYHGGRYYRPYGGYYRPYRSHYRHGGGHYGYRRGYY